MKMVSSNQDGADEVDLEQRLTDAWQNMLGSQQAARTFIAESSKRPLGEENDGGQIAFFNNRLVSVYSC